MLSFNRAHRKQLVAQRDVGKGGEFSSNALGHCELLVLAVLLTSGDKYKHRHLYLLYLFILTVLSAGSAFISIQVRWSIIAVPLSLNPLQYRKQRKRLVAVMIFHITWTFAGACLSVQGVSQQSCCLISFLPPNSRWLSVSSWPSPASRHTATSSP